MSSFLSPAPCPLTGVIGNITGGLLKMFKERDSWSFQSPSRKHSVTSELGGLLCAAPVICPACGTARCHCHAPNLGPLPGPKLEEAISVSARSPAPRTASGSYHSPCTLVMGAFSSTCKNAEDFFCLATNPNYQLMTLTWSYQNEKISLERPNKI